MSAIQIIDDWLKNNTSKAVWGLAGVGVVFLVVGWSMTVKEDEEIVVHESAVTSDTTIKENNVEVLVDIAGAINSPGVYAMQSSQRVVDVIEKAGGLSDEADLEWVAVHLNRAAQVYDGQKIYISGVGDEYGYSQQGSERISINQASTSELEKLWGIGEVTAGEIVAHRPYTAIEELLDKEVVTKNVFDRNKDKLSL